MARPTPDHILQVGLGFWGSKALLTAVRAGLFTELARGPRGAEELGGTLGWHPRGVRDFLDALVALGFLAREGGRYRNTEETALFLDRSRSGYVGAILEMADARLYPFWGDLGEALRTGLPQNESKGGGPDHFEAIYADPGRLEAFLKAMTGISGGAAQALAQAFPWDEVDSFADIGCAEGCVPAALARAHPHLRGVGFDLPQVAPFFDAFARAQGLEARLRFQGGDLFQSPLPEAEVYVFGHMLHGWDLEGKRRILRRAYEALPEEGRIVVYDTLIDDDRSQNAFGLLMSLNMLIETAGGFDYTGADCAAWMREAGFQDPKVQHLLGPTSMVVATK